MEDRFSNPKLLLNKDVTRKEFLSYIALLFLTLIGISSLLKNLKNISNNFNSSDGSADSYGGSPYGGTKGVN